MRRSVSLLLAAALASLSPRPAAAFCGFYVAKADTKLYNRASRVVLVRDADRTVLTMASDFRGDPKEFAVVIPVPTFIERGQIHVADNAVLDHLDAYSAPRLVEYFDENPCRVRILGMLQADQAAVPESKARRAASLGVKVEAEYTVGEYDIIILSAEQSGGLETWLRESGYRIPEGAGPVLGSYIRQGMRFFVARVNLEEQARLGYTYLRPIQVAYETPKFMLPIRLGTVNADGPQELFVFALTRRGRIETTNYRTVRLPTGMNLPLFVRGEFDDFYRAMFDESVRRDRMRTVFLEYAWDMAWCDPCAADPLSREELRGLGVFWLEGGSDRSGGAQEVFLTRLHVRYDADHFPEDLVFQETADRENFQGRYVLNHPWEGTDRCEGIEVYYDSVRARQEEEALTLARLTAWDINDVRRKAGLERRARVEDPKDKSWWERLWGE